MNHILKPKALAIALLAIVLVAMPGCLASQVFDSAYSSYSSGNKEQYLEDVADVVNDDSLTYNARTLTQRGYFCSNAEAKSATVMVYMCGADLESQYGAATDDLNEMLKASFSDNVNVIVQTGGCSDWQNSVVSSNTDQRYRISGDGFEHLDDVGLKDMTKASTLSDFIQYCSENYPADRNILVLWDHGGGTMGGYAVDENFPYSESMSLSGVEQALSDGGVKFDFVGFDACLMATAETAFVAEPYADYLIASQMTEPGQGWNYTRWLSKLASNPAINTVDLGKVICDDFVSDASDPQYSDSATLSVTDLTRLPDLFSAADGFFQSAQSELTSENFAQVSQARSVVGKGSKYEDEYDCIDISALADNLKFISHAADLKKAVASCVVYKAATSDVTNHNGLNMYFPYTDLSKFPDMAKLYANIGYSKSYVAFLGNFVSIMAGGQALSIAGTTSSAQMGVTSPENSADGTGTQDSTAADSSSWQGQDWYSTGIQDEYNSSNYYGENSVSSDMLTFTEGADGTWELVMPADKWKLITDVQQVAFYDDGNGYIALGSDSIYDDIKGTTLSASFDNTWVTLDGQTVCYYSEQNVTNGDGTWSRQGYVPAELKGANIEIVVIWDNQHPNGYVAGYRKVYSSSVAQKGLFPFNVGDQITFLCDYYDYNGTFNATYEFGSPVTYNGNLAVSMDDIGAGDVVVYYALTDIYGSTTYTEGITFTD